MLTLRDLLLGLLVPAVAAVVLTAATARWIGCACGLAAGYLIGQASVDKWPAIPAPATEQWLIYLTLAALAGDGVLAWRKGRTVRWTVGVILTALLLAATLKPFYQYHWEVTASVLFTGALVAASLGMGWSSHWQAKHLPVGLALTAWLFITGASGLACALGGSQKLGQFGGALAAALAGCLVVSLRLSNASLERGGLNIVLILWIGLLLNGCFYASVPSWAAGALALSPLCLWIWFALPGARIRPWQKYLFVLGLLGLVLLAVLVPMGIEFARASQGNGGAYDYGY